MALREALKQLPPSESEACVQAEKVDPNLIETESNPAWFLHSNNQCHAQAAAGLAKYWSERKSAFGEERFTRSLTDLSGKGALTKEDIELLQTGYIAILPRDSEGRHVVCIDVSRLVQKVDRLSFCRVNFLVGHSLLQSSPTNIVLVRRLFDNMSRNPVSVQAGIDHAVSLFEEVLPVTVHAMYVTLEMKSQRPKAKSVTQNAVPSVLNRVGKELASKAVVLTGKNPIDLGKKLDEKGVTQLPENLGGSWSYDKFETWWKELSQPKTLQPQATDEAALLDLLDGYISASKPELDEAESVSSDRSKVLFAFGVLGMIQDERKVSLRTLLQEPETHDLLLSLVGESTQISDLLNDCAGEVLAEMQKENVKVDEALVKDTSMELLSALLGEASNQPEEGETADLIHQVSTMIGGRQGGPVIPPSVQSCLGILCLLEDEQGRQVTDLLQDTSVVELLEGMLDSSDSLVKENDMEAEPEVLDTLAERLAKDLASRSDDATMTRVFSMLMEAEKSGSAPDPVCVDLVGTMLDSALNAPLLV